MLHSRMLRYLDEVARAGSIRRAADRLGIAASSINRQIIALEQEYGVALFERLPRRLRLTVAGELLIAHVRQTLREQELLRARFIDLQGRRRGLIRVATINGLVPTFMPLLLDWMRRHHPLVKLVVRALSLEAVIAAVIAGEAEFGLGYQMPADPKLRVLARASWPIGAVAAPGHPLAARAEVSLADCIGYPMVVPDPGITIGALLAEAFERSAIVLDTVVETNSIELMRHAALQGEAIAFMSEIEAEPDRRAGRLAFLPLRLPVPLQQELRLVTRRAGGLDTLQSRVAEALGQMLGRASER